MVGTTSATNKPALGLGSAYDGACGAVGVAGGGGDERAEIGGAAPPTVLDTIRNIFLPSDFEGAAALTAVAVVAATEGSAGAGVGADAPTAAATAFLETHFRPVGFAMGSFVSKTVEAAAPESDANSLATDSDAGEADRIGEPPPLGLTDSAGEGFVFEGDALRTTFFMSRFFGAAAAGLDASAVVAGVGTDLGLKARFGGIASNGTYYCRTLLGKRVSSKE